MSRETEAEILRRLVSELHTIAMNLAYALRMSEFDNDARLKSLRAWEAFVLRSPGDGALLLTAKRRDKLDKELGTIRERNPKQACWVCGTRRSMKTSRESYGIRCRKCLDEGKTTPDTVRMKKLLAEIELGHKPREMV